MARDTIPSRAGPAGAVPTRDLPMQSRAAPVRSVDAEKRTIELVWTTGAPVQRYDWWTGRRYVEELEVSETAVDLGRLNGGAPLLNTHGQWDLDDVIGVVERAWIEGAEGRAVVRFSDREDVEPYWRDVTTGIIRNVSVGYAVREYQITERENALEIRRAVDWEPMELSLVPVPADAGAGTRSAGGAAPALFTTRMVRHAPQPSLSARLRLLRLRR
ncbi:MAG: HK97 family phage prohead protease [Phenylobacterium sp.]|uniref:HK97 family phage prohead protease n=1 Tax=Phenylobacterium sp. TaxID=1871053 RepID=UPI0025E7F065|nr:HK97 family phage prohead protease [Phenylobacterium sp.]MCA6305669.1 HK97 family phage prohead protease [Phenylobacterium sp.]